jgi:tRNA acetyltransferase TAN1
VLTQAVLFFKTRAPLEPVSFIRRICEDTANGVEQQRCRFVRRLTPITATEKATEKGLEDVARQVIAPHFHVPDQAEKKVSPQYIPALLQDACSRLERILLAKILIDMQFAIRISIRNNKQFARDEVIKKVASIVGNNHKVDLSGYDLLILVEIYKVRNPRAW